MICFHWLCTDETYFFFVISLDFIHTQKKATTFHDKILLKSLTVEKKWVSSLIWYNIETKQKKKMCMQTKRCQKSQRISISTSFQKYKCLLSVLFDFFILFFSRYHTAGMMFMSWQHLLFIITYSIHHIHELITWKYIFFLLLLLHIESLIPQDMKNAWQLNRFYFWQWTMRYQIDNIYLKLHDWWWCKFNLMLSIQWFHE